MKTTTRALALPLIAFLGLALSGCATPASADGGVVLTDIYTSVAQTIAAQAGPVTPTASPAATSTPLPTVIPFVELTATPTAGTYGSPYSYAGGCDNAAYVSDVTVADGTELAPGETFTKTWEMVNTGSCTWSKSYSISFLSGDSMEGSQTTITHTVAPGESANISVSLTAPDNTGTYTGYWTLTNASGTSFGEDVYVLITVSDDVDTSTPTVTPTATAASPTSTPEAGPTATPSTITPTSSSEPRRQHPTRTPTATPDAPRTGTPNG